MMMAIVTWIPITILTSERTGELQKSAQIISIKLIELNCNPVFLQE